MIARQALSEAVQAKASKLAKDTEWRSLRGARKCCLILEVTDNHVEVLHGTGRITTNSKLNFLSTYEPA